MSLAILQRFIICKIQRWKNNLRISYRLFNEQFFSYSNDDINEISIIFFIVDVMQENKNFFFQNFDILQIVN